jgi:hypothetical protein
MRFRQRSTTRLTPCWNYVHIAGVANKHDIDDLRESPGLDIILLLKQKGARVTYTDPYIPSLRLNLLVNGVAEALAATRAIRVYIANLMTEANESLGLSVAEHIERIYEHAGGPIFDYALVSTGAISAIVRERYAAEGAEPTRADIERIEAMGIRCITGDFVAEGDVLRHAADRVTEALLALPCAPLSLGAERTRRIGEQVLNVNSPRFLRNRGATILHSDAA